MYPFRNILFPTDFTEHARGALKYAAAFARKNAGRVVLFSVQAGSVPANLLTMPEHAFNEEGHEWLAALREQVKALLADPLLVGLEVEPLIVEGDPAPEIASAAHELDIDLITIVTHGRTGLARALWGSTAEEIIAEAPCPVLTIRPPQRDFVEHRDGQTRVRLNRVLLATNFRPSAERATRIAVEIANRTGAELHSIYVVGDYLSQLADLFPESGGRARADLRGYVGERMTALTHEAGQLARTHLAEGRPYEEIVRAATMQDVDLIVMGTNVHASLWGGAPALGPEIERVVRNAPCPVLCVPAAARAVTPHPARVAEALPQM